MNNLTITLKTNYPLIWANFENFLEGSYPYQNVVQRLETYSFDLQVALLSTFLVSKKLSLKTSGLLTQEWDFFLKKVNSEKKVFVSDQKEFVCQKEMAIKVITQIFQALNTILLQTPSAEMADA
jgi:hypothetical protein